MFDYFRRKHQGWLRLREVQRDEQTIDSLKTTYHYALDEQFRLLGIPVKQDVEMEVGAVLYFAKDHIVEPTAPPTHQVRLNATCSSYDQRLALGMLLVHLAVTNVDRAYSKLPAYIVYGSDLEAAEGPSTNEQWVEYMQCLDLLLPAATFKAILQHFPLNPTYAIQRIVGVPVHAIQTRARGLALGLQPILPKTFRISAASKASHAD